MEPSKMNATEIAPNSPVLSQIFVVLTALTGSLLQWHVFLKKPHTQKPDVF